jgi:hypothetical protein
MLTIARVFQLLPDQCNGAMGTAFSYAAAFGHGRSVWLMLLYDYFFWMGSIDERDISEREAEHDGIHASSTVKPGSEIIVAPHLQLVARS